MVLFFIHEVAMEGLPVNDLSIKWMLLFLSLFIGFFLYGVFGEYQFKKAISEVKNIDFREAGEEMVSRFKSLFRFTESSYFLPKKGRQLREEITLDYANFLMNLGREDEEALNIYLKAYLLAPDEEQFRNVLVSILTNKNKLTENEIDLLIIILKKENFQSTEIVNHLVNILLVKKSIGTKTEGVYLSALKNQSEHAEEIVKFWLPILLKQNRADHFAIQFYLNAFERINPEYYKHMVDLIGACYLDKRFKVMDPELHDRCKTFFERLEPEIRERIIRFFRNQNISERWKKVRLFRSEDKRLLKTAKTVVGLDDGGGSPIKDSFITLFKGLLFSIFDTLNWVGSLKWKYKLLIILLAISIIFVGKYWVNFDSLFPPEAVTSPIKKLPEVVNPEDALVTIHTLQIAAVTSQSQANKIMRKLTKNKIKGVYLIKTKRESGGFWYKIRLGKFSNKQKAQQYAASLIEQKLIRNYFIISLGETRLSQKNNLPLEPIQK